jgi:hypothetical protein
MLMVEEEAERIDQLYDVRESRARVDLQRDVEDSFLRLLQLPRATFFKQLRMRKGCFLTLAETCAPFVDRDPSRRGSKPTTFCLQLDYSVTC